MDEILRYSFPAVVFVWLFVMGCAVGSFLNVCIYRLPRHKNLLWPSSRCGQCLQPIPLYYNVPLFSWWWLRGRCYSCRAPFSMRYFWVELLTGLVVVGLYSVEVALNVHRLSIWQRGGLDYLLMGLFPPQAWFFIGFHTVLASLLIVATGCLLDQGRIPRPLVVTGVVAGLTWALLCPWPEPLPMGLVRVNDGQQGFMPRPVWVPLPDWLPPRSLLLGLATAAAGILGPTWMVRCVDFLAHRFGREGLGSAAALLAMTGGFLGWQPLVVAFAVAGVLALLLRQPRFLSLLLVPSIVVAWLGWSWLGYLLWPWLFQPLGLAALLVGLGLLLLANAFLHREQLIPAEAGPPAGG